VISIAPLALVLGQAFAPEYERAISSSTSVVAALGYLRGAYDDGILGDPVDARYLRAEGKFRYYPDGYRLSQLLVGASVGVTSANGTDFDDRGRTRDYSVSGPSIGLEVGYSGLPWDGAAPVLVSDIGLEAGFLEWHSSGGPPDQIRHATVGCRIRILITEDGSASKSGQCRYGHH
jgi:hypothetical protein